MSTPVNSDKFLVNRGGSSYYVTHQNIMAELLDTDLLLVNRGSASFKITGEDFKDSVGPSAVAPYIAAAVLADDSPGGARFTSKSFTTTLTMGPEGTPISTKFLKPYVIGAITAIGQTSAITSIGIAGWNQSAVWSNDLTSSSGTWHASGNFGPEQAFDGSPTTGNYAQALGSSITFAPSSLSWSSSIEVMQASINTTAAIDGGSSVALTADSWTTVASGPGSISTSLIITNGSGNANLKGIRVDGNLLVDSWNQSQVWSDYLTANYTLYTPTNGFNSQTTDSAESWNGVYNVTANPPYTLTFTPPSPIPGPIDLYTKTGPQAPYSNTWTVDTGSGLGSPTSVVQNTWVEIVPSGQSLTSLVMTGDMNGTGFAALKAAGEMLVDTGYMPAGADIGLTLTNDDDFGYFQVGDVVQYAWNQSAVWSNGGWTTGTTNKQSAFDGSTATDAVVSASTITYTPTTPIVFSSTLEVWTGSGSNIGADQDIIYNGTNIGSGVGGTWISVATSGGTLTSIGITNTLASTSRLNAVRLDGRLLVDTGIPGSPAYSLTAIDSSVPSMDVDGGTWAVGDVVTNTVERQETNIPTTDTITTSTTVSLSSGYEAVLYTGTASTKTISGLSITPDFVWIKSRDGTFQHSNFDTLRGAKKYISTSQNIGQATEPTTLTSFTSDGWTMDSDGGVNANGVDYVAWCFDAGDWATTTVPSDWDQSEVWSEGGTGTPENSNYDWPAAFKGSLEVPYALPVHSNSLSWSGSINTAGKTVKLYYICQNNSAGQDIKINGTALTLTAQGSTVVELDISSQAGSAITSMGIDRAVWISGGIGIVGIRVGDDLLVDPWNQGEAWSDSLSFTGDNFANSAPASNAFDGNLGTYANNQVGGSAMVFTCNTSGVIKLYAACTNNTTITLDGTTVTTLTGGATPNWYTVGSVTAGQVVGVAGGYAGGLYVHAFSSDDVLLVNEGTIRAGSLNEATYNQADVWSNSSASNGQVIGGSFALLFNGDTSNGIQVQAASTSYATLISGKAIAATSVSMWTFTGASTPTLRVTDTAGVATVFSGATNGTWTDFAYSGEIEMIEYGYLGGSGSSDQLYGLKINGKILVDTGTTPPSVPSINSWVKANPDAGFSIVSYTGTGSDEEVAHGLNSPADLVIVKDISSTNAWSVYHTSIGTSTDNYIELQSTAAASPDNTAFQGTAPTSSVFYIGTKPPVSQSGDGFIAYCWAEKSGISKISSYIGNGSANGPVVTCGFEPAFVLFKNSQSVGNWYIADKETGGANPITDSLSPNVSAATNTSVMNVNFNATGFQLLTADGDLNGSGQKYIFMALGSSSDVTELGFASGDDLNRFSAGDTAYYGNQPAAVTGTVKNVVDSGNTHTMQISPANTSWATGGFVTGDASPDPDAKMYCQTSSTGQITGLVSADPGYTQMASTLTTQTVTFPALFQTGDAPDTELPAGTSLACDVSAANSEGSSTRTTNTVTPT